MIDLLKAVVKSVIQEVAVEIPKSYRKKEAVRSDLQALIVSRVKSGEITSKEELDDFFKTLEMSTKALKMVPFEVYQTLKDS